jgi:hypothetical protein
VGQALLLATEDEDSTLLSLAGRRGKRKRDWKLDAYEQHFLLPDDHVALLTSRHLMLVLAPGFASVHAAAEQGACLGTLGGVAGANALPSGAKRLESLPRQCLKVSVSLFL